MFIANQLGTDHDNCQSGDDDSEGDVITVDSSASAEERITSMTYDVYGNLLTVTDPEGKLTSYSYDELNRRITATDANGDITNFIYDNRDNLTRLEDPNNGFTYFEYDLTNNLIKETKPLQQETSYSYDANNNLQTMIETGGRKTVYSYDELNRLVKAEIFSSASDTVATKTVDYSYNKVGTLIGYDDGTTSAVYGYDDLQRRISATVDYGSFNLAHSYTWYGNGMKKSYTDPAGRVRSWSYDNGGRATGLKLGVDGGTGINSSAGEVSTNSFIWNSPSKITLPGGSTLNYGYNGLQELTSVITKDPGENPVIDYGYNYSLDGQVKSKSTEHGNYSYDYDEVNRLTSVTGSAPAEPESYSYDALGNRLSSVGDSDWDYNANNQLLARNNASYSYNIHGSMTEKDVDGVITNYSYSADNRLLTVESGGITIASYYYDPFGRRLWKDVDGTRTNFHYNDEGLSGEYDSAGTELRTYGYYHSSSWTTNPLFIQQNGDYYWYQNDHLGTPQKIIAGNGAVVWSARYDSFGRAEIETASIANNLRFPGQYFDDETVLHYNWNRYYDPDLGRYVTADPIGLNGGINLYGYVDGNPVNLVDPMGLVKWSSVGKGIAAAVGGGATVYTGALASSTGIGAVVGVPSILAGTASFSWGISEIIAGFLDADIEVGAPSPVIMGTLLCDKDMEKAIINDLIYSTLTGGLSAGKLARTGSQMPSNIQVIGSGVDMINTGTQSLIIGQSQNKK